MIVPLKVLLGRTIPPTLLALFVWSEGENFVDGMGYAESWRVLGLLIPVLWLSSIGSDGISENGGFLMRRSGYDPQQKDARIRRSTMRGAASCVALFGSDLA